MLLVTGGSDGSGRDAAMAPALFLAAGLETVAAVPLGRDVYEGTIGFAGPVIDEDDSTELERSRRFAAMGATATTARQLGDRPARLAERRGEPGDVVADLVGRTLVDVVVVATRRSGPPGAVGRIVKDLIAVVPDDFSVRPERSS